MTRNQSKDRFYMLFRKFFFVQFYQVFSDRFLQLPICYLICQIAADSFSANKKVFTLCFVSFYVIFTLVMWQNKLYMVVIVDL